MTDDRNDLPIDEITPEEERELAAVADALRAACPNPSLPDGFAEEVLAAQTPIWSFKRALSRDPLLRAAALLLMAVGVAAPVTALMHLTGFFKSEETVIKVIPMHEVPPVQDETFEPNAVSPDTPVPEELLSEAWQTSLERQNRFAQAAHDWQAHFQGLKRADASSISAQLWPMFPDAWPGLEIRLGGEVSESFGDPSDATAGELWSLLQVRLHNGGPLLVDHALEARVRELVRQGSDADRPFLAGWLAILDGNRAADASLPALQPGLPADEAASLSWSPFAPQ